jgi:hypothetical protein
VEVIQARKKAYLGWRRVFKKNIVLNGLATFISERFEGRLPGSPDGSTRLVRSRFLFYRSRIADVPSPAAFISVPPLLSIAARLIRSLGAFSLITRHTTTA